MNILQAAERRWSSDESWLAEFRESDVANLVKLVLINRDVLVMVNESTSLDDYAKKISKYQGRDMSHWLKPESYPNKIRDLAEKKIRIATIVLTEWGFEDLLAE